LAATTASPVTASWSMARFATMPAAINTRLETPTAMPTMDLERCIR
jgi:hypothetical protein